MSTVTKAKAKTSEPVTIEDYPRHKNGLFAADGTDHNIAPSEGGIQGINLVVLTGGFTYVGYCRISDGFLYMNRTFNVRKWGTTSGMGELVMGPTKETVLDKCGAFVAPLHAVIHMLICSSNWESILTNDN